uniref:Uncharacterized protein n=1 Tax=Arundo donax TaxID=35708 RepID=A0A0A9AZQ9_ARUDO
MRYLWCNTQAYKARKSLWACYYMWHLVTTK